MNARLRLAAVSGLAVAALFAAGCAPAGTAQPPADSQSGTSSTPSVPTTTPPATTASPAAPTTTASPTQAAPDPSGTTPASTPSSSRPAPSSGPSATKPTATSQAATLKPGTNHNEAAAAYAYNASDVQRWIHTPGKGAQPPTKLVFLTFDDGPNHVITPKILDTLKAKGVGGTFFVVGAEVKGAGDMLKRAVAEGHSVAIHTYSHNYKQLYPGRSGNAANIMADYTKALTAVKGVLGPDYSPRAYRYPGGHMSWKNLATADKNFAERNVYWVDWNAMTGDAEPASRRPSTAAGMVKMATSGIREGSKVVVMLAHDAPDKKLTAASLAAVIDAYKKAGYTFGVIN